MRPVLLGMVMLCGVAAAQTAGFQPADAFPLKENGLAIRRHVEPNMPFTVAGTRGVILGEQDGSFEAWILPVKLLSHFTIVAHVDGYPVPIDLNAHAAEIQVFPDHTVITYSHIAFTVRQIMFAPDTSDDGTGAVVLFQMDSIRPMDLTFSFNPEMRSMWPQLNEGVPSGEWVKQGTSGFYVLHMDYPNLAGAVAMPDTQPGIMAPYQEKPHFYPLQFKLHYDPKTDGNKYYPLLMAVGRTVAAANTRALQEKLERLSAALPQLYAANAAQYAHMADTWTAIQTPDKGLNDDLAWAEMSIEQLKTRVLPSGEIGLVAGYYSSGDSARPGFGWLFGRDALYTLYAVNSYGDFALSRDELEFLMKRQRSDGKMMHEYSQTAAFTDWKSLPYMYAAADSNPLFLTAMLDYVQSSGDVDFLRRHREEVEKAWHFETTHDSDGDGIYDNSQGTGWVESWPTGMPHQEIYLALLDQQASAAIAKLANLLGDATTASAAAARAAELRMKIETEYYEPSRQAYAFSRNADGTVDHTVTVFPMIAWWNGGEGLAHPQASFRRWASHDFSTDWGVRDVAESEPFYDPISYHQGSVWPLFTGWASIAEYRTGHSLSGYAHLMQNAEQTTTQDLGAVTELLSGAFFQPFGRSTSHQLWSSAMVIIPALRGMFGIDIDGLSNTVRLDPHLPADWNHAEVDNLHVGSSLCSLNYARENQNLVVRLKNISGPAIRLETAAKGARVAADGSSVAFMLPPVEIAVRHGLPLPGARTAQMKVLEETLEAHSLTLGLEAVAGSTVELKVRYNKPKLKIRAEGATIVTSAKEKGSDGLDSLIVNFPAGAGYQQKTVTLSW
jgi:glycogen debranching enzyme